MSIEKGKYVSCGWSKIQDPPLTEQGQRKLKQYVKSRLSAEFAFRDLAKMGITVKELMNQK